MIGFDLATAIHKIINEYGVSNTLSFLGLILGVPSLVVGGFGLKFSFMAYKKAQEAATAIQETKREIRFRDIISELELCKSRMSNSIQEYNTLDIKSCRIYFVESCEVFNKLENYPAIQESGIIKEFLGLKDEIKNMRSYLIKLENEKKPRIDIPFYHDEIRKYIDGIDKWISILRNG